MAKYILISFIFIGQFSFAQNSHSWKIDTLNLKDIYLDQLDQLYCEYENGRFLTKSKNQPRAYYNDYGAISNIDIRNPQKILLFYRDFQRIVILDNTLSVLQEIDLEDIFNGMVNLVIMSKRNDIWIYDEIKNALIRINYRGQILTETEPMYYYKPGFIPAGIQMVNQKVMLTNKNREALIFDNFGQLIKEVNIPCHGKFEQSNTMNYCLDNNTLTSFKINSDQQFEIPGDTVGITRIDDVMVFATNGSRLVYLKNGRVRWLKPTEIESQRN